MHEATNGGLSLYFRQILHHDLGCASYLLADQGEAAVVDPKWEIDEYLRCAEDAAAVIRHVLETHHHADHVSGRRRLAAATGARMHLPSDPEQPHSEGLHDGEVVQVGRLVLRAVLTAGHRPEHLSYLVSDGARAPGEPCLLLAGDSLLVGDLARPDLAVAMEEGARGLWATLRRLDDIGDHVELWPGHVGGSLCASGSLSRKTSSTIGYERRSNPLLACADPDALLAELSRSILPRPPSVARVVALNQRGADAPPPLRELDTGALAEALAGGVCAIDIRAPEEFDHVHIAGALNLPAGGQGLGTRAAWAIGAEEPIVIVAATAQAVREFADRLYAAGVWTLAGVTVADPLSWEAGQLALNTAQSLQPEQLAPRLAAGDVQLIDVRDPAEWRAGHVQESLHLPLSELGDGRGLRLGDGRSFAVACAAGGRAALAASIMRRRGHERVWRLVGGVPALARQGVSMVAE